MCGQGQCDVWVQCGGWVLCGWVMWIGAVCVGDVDRWYVGICAVCYVDG